MGSPTVDASELVTIGRDRVRDWLAPVNTQVLARHVSRWVCGLSGHDQYLHTERDRLTLRCVGCGHESPGWTTGRPAYQRTWAGDAARHRLR